MSFWIKTKNGGVAHINGAKNMSKETRQALQALMDAVAEQMNSESRPKGEVVEGDRDG